MNELTYQIGKEKTLRQRTSAEQLVEVLAWFSYGGSIKPLAGTSGQTFWEVDVTAQEGFDSEMLSTLLNSLKVEWQIARAIEAL
ncbi:MAG: hypothetical protein WCS37_04740 [Chloroflexota bacterium]|nr:hypothetical protein [Chloroflexota bacterium]